MQSSAFALAYTWRTIIGILKACHDVVDMIGLHKQCENIHDSLISFLLSE